MLTKVKQHNESEGHKLKARIHSHNTLLDAFCTTSTNPTPEENKNIAQEVSLVYHNVKHNLSFRSLDCNVKLFKHMLPEVTKKLSLGRTKAEAILVNVLGKKAIHDVVEHLRNNNVFFAIQTDASNVKNRKFFPISVQYFDINKGMANKIINFLENPDETALGMYKIIDQTLKNLNLSYNNISAFSADNCNANFGANNSLFTELRLVNDGLIKANCTAHIVHNTVRHIIGKLSYDVEGLILKIYAHFSVSAKRRESLKDFSVFTEVEYSELSRHVVTRWLSLNKSIERILKLWKPLLSYFRSMTDCPIPIKKLMFIYDNIYEDTPENEIPEIYLLFLNSFLKIFEDTILSLERNNICITELYHIFSNLRDKINTRLEQEFFGYLVMQKLKNLDKHKSTEIKNDFISSYKVAKSYLLKWFDFSEKSLPYFMSKLKLNHEISFSEIEACLNVIKNKLFTDSINLDLIFDELTLLHKLYNLSIQDNNFVALPENEKWVYIFGKTSELPNICKFISFVLSIPCTSAYVERIFSIMLNKWTETRNRASVELIKTELSVTLNMDFPSCNDFYDYVLTDYKLLSQCRSSLKYEHQKTN